MNSSNHLIKIAVLSLSFCLLFHYVIGQGVYEPVQICDSTTVYDNIPDDDPLPQLFDSIEFADDFAMQWVGQYTGTAIDINGRMPIPDINILSIKYRSPHTIDIIYESFWGPVVGSSEMGYDRYEVQSVNLTNKYVIKAIRDDFKIAIVKDNSNRSILRVLLIKTCGDKDDWKKRVFFLTPSEGINNIGKD